MNLKFHRDAVKGGNQSAFEQANTSTHALPVHIMPPVLMSSAAAGSLSRSSLETSGLWPPAMEQIKQIQDKVDQAPDYLLDHKLKYIELVESGELPKLGSSQSMLSKHPTCPPLMRDEATLRKEYLKKLKAKYIEISAKLQFLKLIRQEHAEWGAEANEAIEAENAALKAELLDCKEKLQASFDQAASLAKALAAERAMLMNEVQEARTLSREVSEMQLELLRLARDKPEKDRLTVAAAEEVLDNQIVQLQALDDELRTVQEAAATAKSSVKRLDQELQSIRPAVAQAKIALQAEAPPGREEVEKLSKLCGWYTSSEEMMKDILSLSSVEAPSENELRFNYDKLSAAPFTLSLIFNPVTQELADAKLVGLDNVDISEALELAVTANDGKKLLSYVRMRAAGPDSTNRQ
ncbi:hypothetical protein FRB95_003455 [Tulasnella sp. JGI-2019a]|nr:hypothetical protein FRB95_003455 [Tulasnella sp. JGI-2019a]